MTTLKALIDKPSPFAEISEWLAYREALDLLEQNSEVSELKDDTDEFIKQLVGNNGV
jgi:hypothetical protein